MSDGRYIAEKDYADFRSLMRAYRSGELTRRDQPVQPPIARPQHSRLVVLLEDLPSGGSAQAERLRREDAREVQDIMVVGAIPIWETDEEEEPAKFTLKLQDNDEEEEENEGNTSLWLPEAPVTATADELLALYRSKDSPIRKYIAGVELGSRSPAGVPIMRWRLILEPDGSGEPRPLLEVGPTTLGQFSDILIQRVPYVGTGSRQTVYSVIPTGDPTPIRAGSQCGLRHFDGTGWGVTEAEPRKYEPAIGDDYPYYG